MKGGPAFQGLKSLATLARPPGEWWRRVCFISDRVQSCGNLVRHRPWFVGVVTATVIIAVLSIGVPRAVAQIPVGFELTEFAGGFDLPIALAQTPDGRVFVAERVGRVRIVGRDGSIQSTPFAEFEVFIEGESGLLGMAIDPAFEQNGYVYLFLTVSDSEQQIIRFTDQDGVGVDRTIIRDNLPTIGYFHNGGCLRIGPDDKLYFSIGDVSVPETSQQLHSLGGKIGRINLDGTAPPDNPFITPTGEPRAVYALGFRNPFRFCFSPDGRLFAGDVGSSGDNQREEINLVVPGANYGWPETEGMFDVAEYPDFTNPLAAYREQGSSITGCTFYDADQFPAEYRGDLFHLDFVSQGLFRVVFDGDTIVSHEMFIQADGGPVDLMQGIDGSLYYTEMYTGTVRKLTYPAGVRDEPTENLELTETPSLCGAQAMPAMILMMPLMMLMHRNGTR